MKMKKCAVLYCAVTIATGIALAADPNAPAVISPTSGGPIAPNGITAASGAGVVFTQPFTDGIQPRGAYTITIPGGVVTQKNTIPTGGAAITAENSVAIAPSPAGSGFTPGDIYATGVSTTNSTNDAVYKNGSSTPFIDGLSASISQHQSDVAFDTVGSFNGALIVTADTSIALYNSTATLLASYTGPSGFVLQHATVARPATWRARGASSSLPCRPEISITQILPALVRF